MTIDDVKKMREAAVQTRKNLRRSKVYKREVTIGGLLSLSHNTVLLCDKILKAYEVLTE